VRVEFRGQVAGRGKDGVGPQQLKESRRTVSHSCRAVRCPPERTKVGKVHESDTLEAVSARTHKPSQLRVAGAYDVVSSRCKACNHREKRRNIASADSGAYREHAAPTTSHYTSRVNNDGASFLTNGSHAGGVRLIPSNTSAVLRCRGTAADARSIGNTCVSISPFAKLHGRHNHARLRRTLFDRGSRST
jgi:hypothetical protein